MKAGEKREVRNPMAMKGEALRVPSDPKATGETRVVRRGNVAGERKAGETRDTTRQELRGKQGMWITLKY